MFVSPPRHHLSFFLFFFNDTATTEIYTLSLHDALPISGHGRREGQSLAVRSGEHAGPQLKVGVCVKRVPETGARITLTSDDQAIDTSLLGFTISPHEECAVEEALRIAERHGGSATGVALGPAAAREHMQNA